VRVRVRVRVRVQVRVWRRSAAVDISGKKGSRASVGAGGWRQRRIREKALVLGCRGLYVCVCISGEL
jgi:hypothetical protein